MQCDPESGWCCHRLSGQDRLGDRRLWHIDGSSCKTLIEGPLTSRYYYLYAEDAQGGGRWEGKVNMCVAEKEFRITGVQDCFARGFQRSGFQEYDTGEQSSWMVQLTDETPTENPTVTGTNSQ